MEGKTMKHIMLFISLLLALFINMPLQAQTINQMGATYRYNGKNKRKPIGGVYIKAVTANNGVVSDEGNGTFTLALNSLQMGSRIGNVRVTKQGMMVFNQQAVDEWNVRKDPLCLILCNADEFQRQKKNLIAIGERQAQKKYEKKLAELKKQNDAKQLQIDDYYNKLDSLENEYQNALKHMDEYADVFARIDESEVDTVTQRAIELFHRGEIEESLRLLEQGNTLRKADGLIQSAEMLIRMADKAKKEYIDAIKCQISVYKLREEWDKAKSLFKELADIIEDVDTLTEYADFCIERGYSDEAKTYYQKALDRLHSKGNSQEEEAKNNKEIQISKKLETIQ